MVNWRGKPGRTVALLPHPARANPGCSWRKNWTWSGRPSRPVWEIRACSAFDKKLYTNKALGFVQISRSSPLLRAVKTVRCVRTAVQCLHTQHFTGCKHKTAPLIKTLPPPNTWLAVVAFPNTGRCGINKKGVNNAPRKHSSSLQICRVSSNWETDNGNCWSWITSWVATDNRGRPIIKLPPPPSAHPLLALTTCPSFAYKVSN